LPYNLFRNTAGVDGGTTHTKITWMFGGVQHFRSTAKVPLQQIINEMQGQVTHIRCIGTRVPPELTQHFEVIPLTDKDPIKAEARIQAQGARVLLNNKKIGRHLVVSVGTGVSYTLVFMGKSFKLPVGNSLGGGFLEGVRKLQGVETHHEFDALALQGKPLDLFIRDVIPNHPYGDFVLSNLGNVGDDALQIDVCHSFVHVVATAIAKDIAVYGMLTPNVVFVGNTLKMKSLRNMLYHMMIALGKKPYFPQNLGFAGAMGACVAVK